jgi:hypothetical protein
MSGAHGRGYDQHGEVPEALLWERVVFRQGDGRYVFEIEEGGLHAKLSSPHGRSVTLPMVTWEGLLDALMGARKAGGLLAGVIVGGPRYPWLNVFAGMFEVGTSAAAVGSRSRGAPA